MGLFMFIGLGSAGFGAFPGDSTPSSVKSRLTETTGAAEALLNGLLSVFSKCESDSIKM